MTCAESRRPVRTLFLSDIHLGFRRARARELAEFLRQIDPECIVLAGDIVDHLNLAQRFFWNDEHTQVVRVLLAKRRAGARIIYLPGNHDSNLSLIAEMLNGHVEVHREWVHRTARGERLLVVHGDQFDDEVSKSCTPWLAWLGNALYDFTIMVNDRMNDVRRVLRMPYWPIAERLKLAVGRSFRYIERFEEAAIRHAAEHGYDGILCGHIHRANLRRSGRVLYCNTGDWVETCSAMIEDASGELRLLRWSHGGVGGVAPVAGLAVNTASLSA
ncbi:MAG: UDP-2,3-diacylglucosamine diphosphatase [Gammaproteobacteria bacterium]